MKKILLFLPLFLLSCTEKTIETPELPKIVFKLVASDPIIGEGQIIELNSDYKTTNEDNLDVVWYDGDKRLNTITRHRKDYLWTAGERGVHHIKCVITENSAQTEICGDFTVIPCDYDKIILGDKKDKVLRNYGTPITDSNNTMWYGYSTDYNTFSFSSGGVLTKALFERNVSFRGSPGNEPLFLLSVFEEQIGKISSIHGNPKRTNIDNMSQAEKESMAESIWRSGALYADWLIDKTLVYLMTYRSSVTFGVYYSIEVSKR